MVIGYYRTVSVQIKVFLNFIWGGVEHTCPPWLRHCSYVVCLSLKSYFYTLWSISMRIIGVISFQHVKINDDAANQNVEWYSTQVMYMYIYSLSYSLKHYNYFSYLLQLLTYFFSYFRLFDQIARWSGHHDVASTR